LVDSPAATNLPRLEVEASAEHRLGWRPRSLRVLFGPTPTSAVWL